MKKELSRVIEFLEMLSKSPAMLEEKWYQKKLKRMQGRILMRPPVVKSPGKEHEMQQWEILSGLAHDLTMCRIPYSEKESLIFEKEAALELITETLENLKRFI